MDKTVEYRLRNEPEKHFKIEAQAEGEGADGSVIRATITRYDQRRFHYEVRFQGEFVTTKENFTEEMYLGTGLAVIEAQIESHVHDDTLLVVHRASGLMDTEHPAQLDWVE